MLLALALFLLAGNLALLAWLYGLPFPDSATLPCQGAQTVTEGPTGW